MLFKFLFFFVQSAALHVPQGNPLLTTSETLYSHTATFTFHYKETLKGRDVLASKIDSTAISPLKVSTKV